MSNKAIAARIDAALAGRPMPYQALLRAIWPGAKYSTSGPLAHAHDAALQQALRRYGFPWQRVDRQRVVFPRAQG